jgi:hypothetical protein
VTYTVDNTLPVVTITAPAKGAYYKTANVPAGAFSVVELNPYTTVESGYSTSEGVQTYTVTATDGAGNVGSDSVTYTVDNTLPVVTITVPAQGAGYALGETVLANWTATDALSGIASAVGTVPSGSPIETGTLGTKTFTVTATDKAGNERTVTVTYSVWYGFRGLLPPYQPAPRSFKVGSSIPLKWQYTDVNGTVLDSSAANPRVRIVAVGTTPPVTDDPILVEDPGNSGLRYDSTDGMWIFNWQTKGSPVATYWIWITSVQTGQANGPFPILLKK